MWIYIYQNKPTYMYTLGKISLVAQNKLRENAVSNIWVYNYISTKTWGDHWSIYTGDSSEGHKLGKTEWPAPNTKTQDKDNIDSIKQNW